MNLRMASRYTKNAGVVFSLKYQVVWCPKYHRLVLTPPIDERMKALLGEIADEHGMTIHAAEVMPDQTAMWRRRWWCISAPLGSCMKRAAGRQASGLPHSLLRKPPA